MPVIQRRRCRHDKRPTTQGANPSESAPTIRGISRWLTSVSISGSERAGLRPAGQLDRSGGSSRRGGGEGRTASRRDEWRALPRGFRLGSAGRGEESDLGASVLSGSFADSGGVPVPGAAVAGGLINKTPPPPRGTRPRSEAFDGAFINHPRHRPRGTGPLLPSPPNLLAGRRGRKATAEFMRAALSLEGAWKGIKLLSAPSTCTLEGRSLSPLLPRERGGRPSGAAALDRFPSPLGEGTGLRVGRVTPMARFQTRTLRSSAATVRRDRSSRPSACSPKGAPTIPQPSASA